MTIHKSVKNQVFFGTFIHSKTLDKLEYLDNTAVCVDRSGKIVAIETAANRHQAIEIARCKLGWCLDDIHVTATHGDNQFFFPGFIDSHVHAPQYPNVGIFGKTTLLEWLQQYTFPMEIKLSNLQIARKVYTQCIRTTLSHGTTTAAYYATTDVKATNLLADLCHAMGQRAFIGRICMDRLAPEEYVDESPEQAVADTNATIEHIRCIDPDFDLVSPIITPRFAPGCSDEMLSSLGKLHKETQLPLQTHISENVDEIAEIPKLFPGSKSYADVYDTHGLLTEKMILAHAIHLTEDEANLIAERKAKVSHCPCSNSSLTSGVARVHWLLEKGIQVGLGTDMSGGYNPSILEAARQAKLVSNHLVMPGGLLWKEKVKDDEEERKNAEERKKNQLSVDQVLYLATRGGAQVVGLADKIGAFEVGMQWDAQLIELGVVPDEAPHHYHHHKDHGKVDVFGWESLENCVAKWVFNGDDRNTTKVWVRGRLVHERK